MKTIQLFIAVLAFIGLSAAGPRSKAVSPPPDGCYPNFTTAEGCLTLQNLTTGAANTGLGWRALFSAGDASFNTGVGAGALVLNTADSNTAVGAAAMLLNTTGTKNTALGTAALVNNGDGGENVAVGFQALFQNTTIGGNSGIDNTAVGTRALQNNTTGAFNTAIGGDVLNMNTTTHDNTAVGSGAMAISTGSNNTAVGRQAGLSSGSGSNNVYLGANMTGVPGENDHTYIRNINTTSVNGMGTDTVTVNLTTGLLGHLSSSRRYKEDIRPMDKTSEALYMLNPVTYRFKKDIDPSQSPDYGLIAEEVAKVDPNLAIRDRNGQIESVRYTAINAMLLNEFLKEHRKVEQQESTITELKLTFAKQEAAIAHQRRDFEATIAELKKGMETLVARSKEQDARIQRVSDQVGMSRPAPQIASNHR